MIEMVVHIHCTLSLNKTDINVNVFPKALEPHIRSCYNSHWAQSRASLYKIIAMQVVAWMSQANKIVRLFTVCLQSPTDVTVV